MGSLQQPLEGRPMLLMKITGPYATMEVHDHKDLLAAWKEFGGPFSAYRALHRAEAAHGGAAQQTAKRAEGPGRGPE